MTTNTTMLTDFIDAFVALWLDAAFWLLLGLVIAGLLQGAVSSERLARHLGGRGFMPSLKAALLGMPLPLCSCGVIPAAVGLRRAGASKSATVSFLVSTPETGVDSIAISYALLGPFMTVARLIAALGSALGAAALTLWWGRDAAQPGSASLPSCCGTAHSAVASCCSSGATTERTPPSCCTPAPRDAGDKASQATGCCTAAPAENQKAAASHAWATRLWRGQRFAFEELFGDIAAWLTVGIAFSALVVAFVPPDMLARISQGWAAMLVMAAIGVPMYICASASTPLAAGLLLAGVSPGAVLVFLLAGPATNVATLGIVRRELGLRTLYAYLCGIIAVAIGCGYLVNLLVEHWAIDIRAELAVSEHLIPSTLSIAAGVLLAALTLGLFALRLRRRWAQQRRRATSCRCC